MRKPDLARLFSVPHSDPERQKSRLILLEALLKDLQAEQVHELIRKFEKYESSERMGVGGSTGDSDTGEQSTDNVPDTDTIEYRMQRKNPAETATHIEVSVYLSTGSDAGTAIYRQAVRRVSDHLRR